MQTVRRTLGCALAAAGWLLAGVAHAEPTAELASSPEQRCLSPAVDDRVKPAYPPQLYEMKMGATIDVELVFTAPDRRPKVHIEGDSRLEFDDAIEDYAKQLRVPCMRADGEPVRLRQTFVFTPNDGRKVVWTTPVDEADAGRQEQLKCMVKPSPTLIHYPAAMMWGGREANVLVRARFYDPSSAPSFEVIYDGGHRSFANAVAGYLGELRLPCLAGGPVDDNFEFQFRLDGGGKLTRRVLKDLPLQTFLAAVKPIKPGSVYFDTNTMKCPFDVRLRSRQPLEVNKVEELEEDVPGRHAFLDWLAERELNLDRNAAGEVYGQSMVVHVPCVKIDL